MGNFIIAVILIISVLLFTLVNGVIINNICDEALCLLSCGEYTRAAELLRKKTSYLSFFVRDSELDRMCDELDRLEISLINGEAEPDLRALLNAINEIKDRERAFNY